jgi:hypothetical protein
VYDQHDTNGAFRTPFTNATFTASQTLRWRCQCKDGNQWHMLMGPHDITRTVFQEGGTWKFRITRNGDSAQKNLP